jgi:hypothetical protein
MRRSRPTVRKLLGIDDNLVRLSVASNRWPTCARTSRRRWLDEQSAALHGRHSVRRAEQTRMKAARPIFIIGAPRSGTSITTWALGQHPNIQPMPETAWIASLAVGGYLSHVKGSERGRYSHLSNVEFPLAPSWSGSARRRRHRP